MILANIATQPHSRLKRRTDNGLVSNCPTGFRITQLDQKNEDYAHPIFTQLPYPRLNRYRTFDT